MLRSSFETTELKQLHHRKFMEKFKSSITGGLAPSENFMDYILSIYVLEVITE